MRKMLFLMFTLAFALGLCAAASAEGPAPVKNCVTELYSAEGVYTDSLGNVENYSYHVPQLNADTPAAEEINREIAERFGEKVEALLKNMEGGHSLWMWESAWHAYWQGSRLFLMLSADFLDGSTDYAAWGYDFETGGRVDNAMILESLGISEEEYLENLREKVGLMFDSMYSSVSDKLRALADLDGMREKTLGWLDLEQPMYIDGTGQIVTIVKIASIAGADWYYHLATPFSYG